MGRFGNLFGKKNPATDDNFLEIRQTSLNTGKNQAIQMDIDMMTESRKIGYKCGILSGKVKRDPRYFVDAAILLLCYPPELGFLIATQFTSFESNLGWNPFGSLMLAICKIDYLYSNTQRFFKTNVLSENPELCEVVFNKNLRIQNAAKLLTVAIFCMPNSVKEAKKLYKDTFLTDATVRKAFNEELIKYNENIAREIIGK